MKPPGRVERQIPALLVGLRFLLGPLLFLLAMRRQSGVWLAVGISAGFLSDVFDGIIARRLGVATERLRVADSWTDAAFYSWIAVGVWLTRPEVIRRFARPLTALFALQLFSWTIDLLKYRRIATFHAYTAKAWGVSLFAAALALFLLADPGPFVWLTVVVGLIGNLEGIAMKLVLPTWQHDVPSVWHALRLRRAHETETIS